MKWKRTVFLPLILLTFLVCNKRLQDAAPWYENMPALWDDYHAAVEDARTAEPSEICRTLPAIPHPGDDNRLQWITEEGKELVLVCTMTDAEDARTRFAEGATLLSGDDWAWVTLPFDLEGRASRFECADSLEIRMRMLQLLGLPPDSSYDRIVYFYADREQLLRPSPDCEIEDCEASLDFPDETPDQYRRWFEQYATTYDSENPYPWTRMGYTYDWNRESNPIGPGEFIVSAGSTIKKQKEVTIWSWYNHIQK